jgi:hypothetical protein
LVDGGDRLEEEVVPAEAGVAFAALRVEDPERRPPTRRAISIARDQRLRPLADDVAPEPDPRPTGQFEAEPARLGDRGREATGEPGCIEDQEQRLGPPGERGESTEAFGDLGRLVGPGQPTAWQVEHEQVDRAANQERAGDREALVQADRRDNDEPFEADAAGDGLDGIEAAREVQPGHDRALRLGLRDDPQGDRGPSAGAVAADRDAGRLREPARPQDRVERGEAGVDDAVVIGPRLVPWGFIRDRCDRRLRCQGQCPHDPRSCGTPSSPEARNSGVHISTSGRHRTARLEHLF